MYLPVAKFEAVGHVEDPMKAFLSPAWKRRVTILISTGLYTGYFPLAPGTWGSLLGLLVAISVGTLPIFLQILFVLLLAIVGYWASSHAIQIFHHSDPSKVVIDEVVGILITLIGIPVTGYWFTIGFLLFRLFDILKPAPAKYADQKIKGGLGIMLDDIVAGIYANILLHLMIKANY